MIEERNWTHLSSTNVLYPQGAESARAAQKNKSIRVIFFHKYSTKMQDYFHFTKLCLIFSRFKTLSLKDVRFCS